MAFRMTRHRTHRLRRPALRPHQHGFLLLEVLVALLIFAFGVLGIVGLQASMTQAQTGSKLRGDAAYLAQELIGTMWANVASIDQYNTVTAQCDGFNPCNALKQKVAARLPGGTLTLRPGATGLVEITITWTPPGEDTRTYATAAAIRI